MEAPEKLYILFNHPYTVDYTKLNKRRYDEEVEYIRADLVDSMLQMSDSRRLCSSQAAMLRLCLRSSGSQAHQRPFRRTMPE